MQQPSYRVHSLSCNQSGAIHLKASCVTLLEIKQRCLIIFGEGTKALVDDRPSENNRLSIDDKSSENNRLSIDDGFKEENRELITPESRQELQCRPGNLILMKEHSNYQIDVNASLLNEAEPVAFVYEFDASFFDSFLQAQLADCPIIYDFIRLQNKMETTNEYLFFDCNETSLLQTYLEILRYECSFTSSNDEKAVQSAVQLLLKNVHRVHYHHLVISESSMMTDYTIGHLLKYMTKHYQTVTLTSMAKEFNFNPSYLSVLFKSLAGTTFSEKLLMIKLEKAKRLLITTDLSVQTIVEMIGFKEKSYFHKCFKKYYHATPACYRKENQ